MESITRMDQAQDSMELDLLLIEEVLHSVKNKEDEQELLGLLPVQELITQTLIHLIKEEEDSEMHHEMEEIRSQILQDQDSIKA